MEQTIMFVVLGVLPWVFVAVGGYFLYAAIGFMKSAIRVTATVIAVHESTSTTGSGSDRRRVTTYKPVFTYTDPAGQTQRAETFLASTRYNYPVGSAHPVLVDPQMPEVVRIPGIMVYGFGALFVVLGLIFGIVGIFALRAM